MESKWIADSCPWKYKENWEKFLTVPLKDIYKTLDEIRRKFFWSDMRSNVEEWIGSCYKFQITSPRLNTHVIKGLCLFSTSLFYVLFSIYLRPWNLIVICHNNFQSDWNVVVLIWAVTLFQSHQWSSKCCYGLVTLPQILKTKWISILIPMKSKPRITAYFIASSGTTNNYSMFFIQFLYHDGPPTPSTIKFEVTTMMVTSSFPSDYMVHQHHPLHSLLWSAILINKWANFPVFEDVLCCLWISCELTFIP